MPRIEDIIKGGDVQAIKELLDEMTGKSISKGNKHSKTILNSNQIQDLAEKISNIANNNLKRRKQ